MDKINIAYASIVSVIGAAGSLIANFFGGWDSGLATLIIFMGIDYITGLLVAAVWKKSPKSDTGALESHAGWKGLIKKCVTLLVVLMATRLDIVLQVDFVRTAAVIGFIVNETLSIVENLGLMGVPVPDVVINAIEKLKGKDTEGQ